MSTRFTLFSLSTTFCNLSEKTARADQSQFLLSRGASVAAVAVTSSYAELINPAVVYFSQTLLFHTRAVNLHQGFKCVKIKSLNRNNKKVFCQRITKHPYVCLVGRPHSVPAALFFKVQLKWLLKNVTQLSDWKYPHCESLINLYFDLLVKVYKKWKQKCTQVLTEPQNNKFMLKRDYDDIGTLGQRSINTTQKTLQAACRLFRFSHIWSSSKH